MTFALLEKKTPEELIASVLCGGSRTIMATELHIIAKGQCDTFEFSLCYGDVTILRTPAFDGYLLTFSTPMVLDLDRVHYKSSVSGLFVKLRGEVYSGL